MQTLVQWGVQVLTGLQQCVQALMVSQQVSKQSSFDSVRETNTHLHSRTWMLAGSTSPAYATHQT